jgi:adenine specific DNA methylase Mod
MPDTSKTTAKAEEKPAPSSKMLARAGESSDAAVHNLLAEYGTADANGDDAARKDIDRRLADLGYKR